MPSGHARADVDRAKQDIRQRVWERLDRAGVTRHPAGVYGKIPNFLGADAAADRLAALPAWRSATVVKANPDKAQVPVRARALADGKRLYMAVPKLADERPFVLLDPTVLRISPHEAAWKSGALAAGRKVAVEELSPVDLVVCGSVAVNRNGARIGKGGGFSDLEVALLQDAGLLHSDTLLVTTVHPLQIVHEPLPEAEHDFRVHLIVTADEMISCRPSRPPSGLLWERLDRDRITAMPALAARRP
jgi:5-formyltetrahydrofolate cyclo-ligase